MPWPTRYFTALEAAPWWMVGSGETLLAELPCELRHFAPVLAPSAADAAGCLYPDLAGGTGTDASRASRRQEQLQRRAEEMRRQMAAQDAFVAHVLCSVAERASDPPAAMAMATEADLEAWDEPADAAPGEEAWDEEEEAARHFGFHGLDVL